MKRPLGSAGASPWVDPISRPASRLASVAAILSGVVAAPVFADHGDLDPAFADVGRLGPITDLEGPVWSLGALDNDGVLLAGGEFELDCPDLYCDSPPIRFRGTNFLKRVSGAGVIESSLDAALPENFQVRDVARQPDGKLVVVGRTAETDSPSLIYLKSRLTILRLLANGQLDTTFGHNGLVELPIEVNDSNSEQGGMSVLLEPDGRIVVSGSLNQQLIVLRLAENGSFDDSFGEFGVYKESQRNIDAGLQILHTSGGSYRVLGDRCEVVGLTGAGALDATFGTSGVAMATAQGGPGSCSTIAGLSDDRLLVAGSAEGHGFVTRLRGDGQLDPGFQQAASRTLRLMRLRWPSVRMNRSKSPSRTLMAHRSCGYRPVGSSIVSLVVQAAR